MSRLHPLSLLVLALAGCSPLGPDDERDELRRNRERWRSGQASGYEYVLQQICFCPPEATRPVRVLVVGGAVVQVLDAETSAPVTPMQGQALTIEDLFARIEDAIDRDAHRLAVTYDPQLGYPTAISIDYDRHIIDEEVMFSASDLQLLALVALSATHPARGGRVSPARGGPVDRSNDPVMTILEADVPADRWSILREGLAEAGAELPRQILRSYLVQSREEPTLWRLITLWRSQADLEEYRRSVRTPRGILIFREAGVEPRLSVGTVAAQLG